MEEFSVLIGGKAGFGIDKSGSIISFILNRLGYHVYVYRDYPSIIRGGHTFSIIRASRKRISSHKDKVDFILALNQDTVTFHRQRVKEDSVILYDADSVKCDGLCPAKNAVGISVGKILKEADAPEIMRNTCIIGSFCKAAGIDWTAAEGVLKKEIPKDIELNLKVARAGYDSTNTVVKIDKLDQKILSLLTGNEAIGLGLVKAGLKAFIAYPMTPTSGILHFLAVVANDFGLKVIHPENEIAVMLMALGFAYSGEPAAVCTSGGGFCLMTEGLSLSGMAELPVVVVLGQRPGPSTGLPTYTSQTELQFALYAGQGEFVRFLVAPSDAEEAYRWAGLSLNISRKFQIPSILLTDKTLCEGLFNFDIDTIEEVKEEGPLPWDRAAPYKRYAFTESGVSPLAFAPEKDVAVKVNSYEHDEYGITTEDPVMTKRMNDKRLSKEKYLAKELEKYETVKVYGDKNSSIALICWGSNRPVCEEAAKLHKLRVVQPIVLSPFPISAFKAALKGAKKIISVENNSTGQLKSLISGYGIEVDEEVLKYDGRPFSVDELEAKLREKI